MLLSVIRLTIFQFYWIQILATEVLLSFTRPFSPQFFHLTFGWSMALRPTKVEWRFTAKEFGERSAVRIGTLMMLTLCAECWDMLPQRRRAAALFTGAVWDKSG